jgi:hypothetical protein
MKNIIIAGYPKSGNTWITRLVAELVGCPVSGFWREPNNKEIAIEGQDRVSDFRCFKSHHQLHELEVDINSNKRSILYVIRDPRDVTVSGAHYFNLTIDQMLNAVLYGSQQVHHWCRISWNTHWKTYWDKGILFVRYEDMLQLPEQECLRILNKLDVNRDINFIINAINRQSFRYKRDEFIKLGENHKATFMRAGKCGQWKQILSEGQKDIFVNELSEDLRFLGYEI